MSAIAVSLLLATALGVDHFLLEPPADKPAPVAVSASTTATLAAARAAEVADMPRAVKLYREASAAGSGAAAKRLYEIYMKGETGVERDMAEARRQLYLAQVRGEEVPVAKRLRVTEQGHVQMY